MLRTRYRQYREHLSKQLREDTFPTLVLYAIFLSLLFLLFAFRGVIVSFFISKVGVSEPPALEGERGEESPLSNL